MRWSLPLLLAFISIPAFSQDPRYSNKLSPYVASPTGVVDRMLELARIKPGETLYDLGSGDGRILIAAVGKYNAKAVGVEISPKLAAHATTWIEQSGYTGRARVIQGDVMDVDLTGADVVTMYLASDLNLQLRPRLEKFLKPGARVVSHDYAIPGWKPTKVEHTNERGRQSHVIYLYEMPPVKQ